VLLLIGSYLLLVFVIPIALSLIVSFRALPTGRNCAQCGAETLPIRARALAAVSSPRTGVILHRRWCMSCRWEGVTRLPAQSPAVAQRVPRMDVPLRVSRKRPVAPAALPGDPGNATQAGGPRTATQTLDVRSVTVDGNAFRVMLQCWHRTGLFYGRFVFVAPSGRLWLDGVEAFTGSNQNEVLGQARSLTDGLLENRLRKLVAGA